MSTITWTIAQLQGPSLYGCTRCKTSTLIIHSVSQKQLVMVIAATSLSATCNHYGRRCVLAQGLRQPSGDMIHCVGWHGAYGLCEWRVCENFGHNEIIYVHIYCNL